MVDTFRPGPRPADPTPLDDGLRREAFHYLRAIGCPPDLADDLTQEACVALWRRGWVDDRPRPVLRAALRSAARFQLLEHRRRAGRAPGEVAAAEQLAEAVDRAWQQQGLHDDLDRWLDALAQCRGALTGTAATAAELFYDRQLSRSDVAARLGMRENGVKTLLQRLRATLRDCVQRRLHGGGDDA